MGLDRSTTPDAEWTSERTLRLAWAHTDEGFARRAAAWSRALTGACDGAIHDAVPGVRTLTLLTDPLHNAPRDLVEYALNVVTSDTLIDDTPARIIEIPVCFDEEFGPDLERVAHRTQDPVALLCTATLRVGLFGFAPGFAYLDGLPEELYTARLDSPRPRIAPGSVGIAGSRAGLYPGASPGGWNIIGRTPRTLFDHRRDPPTPLALGDHVRFVPIDRERFDELHRREQV